MEPSLISLDDVSIHHFAVVVPNIERYLEKSIWRVHGDIVQDPLQGARLCMVAIHQGIDPAIELVEPVDKTSPVWASVTRGTSWHHLCLQVPSVPRGDELIRQYRLLAVTEWKHAVLFQGRFVRFAYSRNRELVEFLSEELPDGHDTER